MAEENNSGLNLKVLIIMMVVMIIITGIFSYVFMSYFVNKNGSNQNQQVTTEEESNQSIGDTYSLGDYVVNLAGSGGYQFIKASIVVEVDDQKVISELEKRNPQIRDIIIVTLREQKIEDIEDPEATIIKNQILTRINEVLSKGMVESVWFTQFVVQ